MGYDSLVGNLRNGSNDGLCNVNCRNDLSRANWNYGGCDVQKSFSAKASIKLFIGCHACSSNKRYDVASYLRGKRKVADKTGWHGKQ